ncbi:uncharacterized protein C8R40DRAFT_1134779 [Lentinula edodes]|uniref:uncharacterized protein n=1 Tax=Lentinula edodes TaxID=5353 RepID=UPI001E8EA9D7|nr:uncharacterized protein C8R40DRAFT_1134779 [Lentinula edodes]KAH7868446.1 hypothetical protein C8R40DRAFT_1134779 [Lentinula edodes]
MKRKPDLVESIIESNPQKEENHHWKRMRLHVEIPTSLTTTLDTPQGNASGTPDDIDVDTFSSLSPDSLFDEVFTSPSSFPASPPLDLHPDQKAQTALRTAPPIPGLFFDPSVRLSEDLAEELAGYCMCRYFNDDDGKRRVNQVMLFERAPVDQETVTEDAVSRGPGSGCPTSNGLPPPLLALLDKISDLIRPPLLSSKTHELLFPSFALHTGTGRSEHSAPSTLQIETHSKQTKQARQAILNLYAPGEGISPHVDLLRRFGDGIIGVSLCGGCVMRFERIREEGIEEVAERVSLQSRSDSPSSSVDSVFLSNSNVHELYLPPNSIIVLSGEARYKWTHGIERRTGDWVSYGDEVNVGDGEGVPQVTPNDSNLGVKVEWIPRTTRLSITFRWLLPGADIVGDTSDCEQ